MVKQQIRVRIAPSPTGFLHVGTARTALFNWLFARQHGGAFLLRIEDTDRERSKPEYETDILKSLEWIGLTWDENVIRQSERGDIYERYLNQLLKEKHAYYCFCTKEELEAQRQSQITQGLAPKYSGKCRSVSEVEIKSNHAASRESVIRFCVAERHVSFTDIIRGKISFDASLMGDIVVAKSAREPLYNLAVVIDDAEMKISHVIRGEDHLGNTPKQILLEEALELPMPHYAHLPLILDFDRSKMSKRNASTAVLEYREAGYLPDALVNFLGLLGWHPKDDREILNREEFIKEFDLTRVQKSGAVFNLEKLEWMNSQYLRRIPESELARQIIKSGITSDHIEKDRITRILRLVKDRMKKLSDFKLLSGFLFELPDYPVKLLNWKETVSERTEENLRSAIKIIQSISGDSFSKEHVQTTLAPLGEERGRGEVFWPLRVALSGSEASPGPFEIMEVLGKDESLRRLERALVKLGGNP